MTVALLLCAAGLGLLYFGAETLVRGAATLGLRFGLSPLMVGLTIVAFGTSAPELAVSISAAMLGKTDMAIGNIVGSNIVNIGLILGLSVLIRPMPVDIKLIRMDVPIMIGVAFILGALLLDGVLSRLDGVMLIIGIIAFIGFNMMMARGARQQAQAGFEAGLPHGPKQLWRDLALVVIGLVVLSAGGQVMVTGAIDIARFAGLSEAVIGLTIVAAGTSLPELATSMLAAAKRMGDISMGNIIGSNIFNILAILGTSSLLIPLPQGGVSRTDLLVMLLFSLSVLPLARSGFVLSRREGALLLLGYGGYITWLMVYTG